MKDIRGVELKAVYNKYRDDSCSNVSLQKVSPLFLLSLGFIREKELGIHGCHYFSYINIFPLVFSLFVAFSFNLYYFTYFLSM